MAKTDENKNIAGDTHVNDFLFPSAYLLVLFFCTPSPQSPAPQMALAIKTIHIWQITVNEHLLFALSRTQSALRQHYYRTIWLFRFFLRTPNICGLFTSDIVVFTCVACLCWLRLNRNRHVWIRCHDIYNQIIVQ